MAPAVPRGRVQGGGWDRATPELQEKLAKRLQRLDGGGRSGQVLVATPHGGAALDSAWREGPGGAAADRDKDAGRCKRPVAKEPPCDAETRGDVGAKEPAHVEARGGGKAPAEAPAEDQARVRREEAALGDDAPLRELASVQGEAEGEEEEARARAGSLGQHQEVDSCCARPARSRGACSWLGFWFVWLAACAAGLAWLVAPAWDGRWTLVDWTGIEVGAESQLAAAELKLCQRVRAGDAALVGPSGSLSELPDVSGAEHRIRCARLLAQARRQRLQLLARVVVFAIAVAATLCALLALACCRQVVGAVPAAAVGATMFAIAAATTASAVRENSGP